MQKGAIVHYDEIALKGGNRKAYEKALVKILSVKLSEHNFYYVVHNQWGRIRIEAGNGKEWDTQRDDALRDILKNTPGVAVFGIANISEPEESAIYKSVTEVAQCIERSWNTFKVDTKRTDKLFQITSPTMNERAGSRVLDLFPDAKVKLKNPEITIRIEVLPNEAYIYEYERGLSGLPVSMSGKAVALLSGGFDSPVATHLCAVRGVRPVLLHFHSYPHTSRAAIEKVEDLAKVLRETSGPITLLLVPMIQAQKEITLVAPERLRVVLYRRLMMKMAERIARRYGAKAIITGESIGQVASQTLENIRAVEDATTLPVLRPLSGTNKKDIISQARRIHTHAISVLPHDDTCTVFMPKHPELRAKLKDVHEAEKSYDSQKLIADMIKNMEVIKL